MRKRHLRNRRICAKCKSLHLCYQNALGKAFRGYYTRNHQGLNTYSFVVATSGGTSTPYLFRTWKSNRDTSSLYQNTKIWEAARATSAAPTYFDYIEIGPSKRKFGDGGTGANNPIVQLYKEAIDLCEGERLEDNLCSIVSIGTGQPNLKKFGEGMKEVIESVIRIATETEETANDFHQMHPELENKYWRFNTPRGLGEVELDEAKEMGTIEDFTEHYLKTEDVHKQIKACAQVVGSSTVSVTQTGEVPQAQSTTS